MSNHAQITLALFSSLVAAVVIYFTVGLAVRLDVTQDWQLWRRQSVLAHLAMLVHQHGVVELNFNHEV